MAWAWACAKACARTSVQVHAHARARAHRPAHVCRHGCTRMCACAMRVPAHAPMHLCMRTRASCTHTASCYCSAALAIAFPCVASSVSSLLQHVVLGRFTVCTRQDRSLQQDQNMPMQSPNSPTLHSMPSSSTLPATCLQVVPSELGQTACLAQPAACTGAGTELTCTCSRKRGLDLSKPFKLITFADCSGRDRIASHGLRLFFSVEMAIRLGPVQPLLAFSSKHWLCSMLRIGRHLGGRAGSAQVLLDHAQDYVRLDIRLLSFCPFSHRWSKPTCGLLRRYISPSAGEIGLTPSGGLTGTIPAVISKLQQLTWLYASPSSIGILPTFWQALSLCSPTHFSMGWASCQSE